MATHSCILAWRIPWTEEPGELYSSRGRKELAGTEATQGAPCARHCFRDRGASRKQQL